MPGPGLLDDPNQGWGQQALRYATGGYGLLDHVMMGTPSTAAGLINAAIPGLPLGDMTSAQNNARSAYETFKGLSPLTRDVAGWMDDMPTPGHAYNGWEHLAGGIVPFPMRKLPGQNPTSAGVDPRKLENGVMNALQREGAGHQDVLNAAQPLLAHLRDNHGLSVMMNGLPEDPNELGNALLSLSRAARSAPASSTYPHFQVYFDTKGSGAPHRFEDGYSGETGLRIPTTSGIDDVASILQKIRAPK